MSDGWGKFWLALSMAAFAGVIVGVSNWTGPFEVGALAQWVSAGATFGAIWIALRNTRQTLRETARREAEKQEVSDRAYLGAVLALAREAVLLLREIRSLVGDQPHPAERFKTLARAAHLEGIVASMDRIPVHTSPVPEIAPSIGNIRVALNWVINELAEIVEKGDDATFSVNDELELIESTWSVLQACIFEKYPDLASRYPLED